MFVEKLVLKIPLCFIWLAWLDVDLCVYTHSCAHITSFWGENELFPPLVFPWILCKFFPFLLVSYSSMKKPFTYLLTFKAWKCALEFQALPCFERCTSLFIFIDFVPYKTEQLNNRQKNAMISHPFIDFLEQFPPA